MDILLLLAGLALIIKSADVLIDSTSKIARKYGVSTFVIGITVVAFGTSAPELVVGIMSAINRTNQLSLGNIVGSSFSNTALIMGICAALLPLSVKDSVVKREIPMLIFAQLALAVMVISDGVLSRQEGIILLLGFVGFVFYVIVNSKKSLLVSIDPEGDIDTDGDGNMVLEAGESSMLKLCVFSIVSLAGLFVGGKLTVDTCTKIAADFGLSETLIGITVVSVATTLPEMVTSIMAIRKKEPDIVIGNCVGSNLFNILLVLGLSSTINPIEAQGNMMFELLLMVFLTVVVFIITLAKKRVSRPIGVVLITNYLAYLLLKVITVFM